MTILRSFVFDLTLYLWTILISVVSLPALVSQRATVWISELWAIVVLLLLRLIVVLSYEVRGRDNLLSQFSRTESKSLIEIKYLRIA